MRVEIARDWVDYVQAAGVLVSLLLAAGALIYAKRSSDASADSARAAAATAAIAMEEVEHTRKLLRLASDQHDRLITESKRRPVLAAPTLSLRSVFGANKLTMGQLRSLAVTPHSLDLSPRVWPAVFEVAFENVGDKAADQTLARVIHPIKVGLWRSDRNGEHSEDVDVQPCEVALKSPAGDEIAHVYSWRIPHLPPRQQEARHLLLVFRALGDYEVELQAQHEEAEPVVQRFLITVSEDDWPRVKPV